MATKSLRRNFFQRLFGRPATALPGDPGCWTYSDGVVTVDLKRAPELTEPSGALRVEGPELPKRVLVFHGEDGQYYAVCNKCTHGGRRVDPDPAGGSLQCCSIGKSTYNYQGEVVRGPAPNQLPRFNVAVEEDKLIVTL
jgi:Rieske Fe-S protein